MYDASFNTKISKWALLQAYQTKVFATSVDPDYTVHMQVQ